MTAEYPVVAPASLLSEFAVAVFKKVGLTDEDAAIAADVLVQTDLRGVETHGLSNLARSYALPLYQGEVNPRPQIRIVQEELSTALMDGDNGLGLVGGVRGMEVAMRKAKTVGAGFVTMRNTQHFGMAAYYAMMALPHDMIGFSSTATGPSMSPTFGIQKIVGTNPISMAAPAGEEPPFVLDMACTVVANNKLRLAIERGQRIPMGWALDGEGRPTTDPRVAREEGMGVPLGDTRELGSHKGYGLAVAVDILGGILSGAGFSALFPPRQFVHTFGAIDIKAFRPVDDFKAMMDDMIRRLRASQKAPGHDRIYVAGEIEHETAQYRRVHGIPLSPTTVKTLTDLSRQLNIPLQLS